jgi:hypothetical protein
MKGVRLYRCYRAEPLNDNSLGNHFSEDEVEPHVLH